MGQAFNAVHKYTYEEAVSEESHNSMGRLANEAPRVQL